MPGSTHGRRMVVATMLAALASLATGGVAQAAPTWLTPKTLAQSTTTVDGPRIAMDAAGDAVAVWAQFNGVEKQVKESFRPAGGTFGPPRTLSGDIAGTTGARRDAETPDVAMNARGDAVVIWRQFDGTAEVARTSFRPAGGAFGPATTISISDATTTASDPHVAISSNGTVEAIWLRSMSGVATIQVARRPAGGSFGLPQEISGGGASAPRIVLDAAGDAVAAWVHATGTTLLVESKGRPAGGAYGPLDTVTPGLPDSQEAFAPNLAITPSGRATIVFTFFNLSPFRGSVQFAERPAGPGFGSQTFGPHGSVSDPTAPDGSEALAGQVVVDADDTAVAAYTFRDASGTFVIQGASRPAGSSFGDRQELSGPGTTSFAPQIAMDPHGDTIAGWQDFSTDNGLVFATERPKGGSFGAVQQIEAGRNAGADRTFIESSPELALDDQGNALAGYVRAHTPDSGTTFLFEPRVAGFDAAGPALTRLSVPGSALTRKPVPMSAAAFDRWTGATLRWSFGDGTQALGGSVAHAYGAPGLYTVTVTATDGVGNRRSATRTIEIANPGTSCVDHDRDGFCASQDCNDNNPNIRPNAREIPGNRVDENCDGFAAPFPTITAGVTAGWSVTGSTVKLTTLRLNQVRHDKIAIKCKGKGCPFRTKKLGKSKRATFNGLKKLKTSQRTFHAGETLDVIVSAKHFNAKVVRYRLKKGKLPSSRTMCLPPGTTRPRNRCS